MGYGLLGRPQAEGPDTTNELISGLPAHTLLTQLPQLQNRIPLSVIPQELSIWMVR